eukprot:6179397-Pleurochrysis_carterae.AAC.2
MARHAAVSSVPAAREKEVECGSGARKMRCFGGADGRRPTLSRRAEGRAQAARAVQVLSALVVELARGCDQ